MIPFVRLETGCGRLKIDSEFGKMKVRRIRSMAHPQAAAGRAEQGDIFGEHRKFQTDFFSSQGNFSYLADMGVPSDIFETGDLDATDRNIDLSGYFKPRTVNLSESTQRMFPDSRPFRFRAKAIKLNLGPCRQMEPDTYSQVGLFSLFVREAEIKSIINNQILGGQPLLPPPPLGELSLKKKKNAATLLIIT